MDGILLYLGLRWKGAIKLIKSIKIIRIGGVRRPGREWPGVVTTIVGLERGGRGREARGEWTKLNVPPIDMSEHIGTSLQSLGLIAQIGLSARIDDQFGIGDITK